MSNKGAQKKKAASQQQRGKPKDTSIENISEATREKIEKIKAVTGWQVSEDIFNLLRDCNFNEALTIDKIISGDAGHPGEQWQEVTRERKKKEPQPVEVQQPQADRSGREKQNRSRPGTGGGARGGRANGQQPGGTKRTAYRQQQQGKRPVGDNRPLESGPSAPHGAPTSQQTGQQYPPQSRGPASQRPQSNGNRRPPVGRGGPGSPKSQPQGQGHVHSQSPPHGGSQTPTQIQQPNQPSLQVPLRETPSPVSQEHSHREPESAPRVEQTRAPVEQLKAQQEEPLSHTQVPQQTQQAHSGQGQDRNSQQRAPIKKAPGKSQFVQANPPTSHTTKSHPPPPKGRRAENFVWQAKEASAASGQVSANRSPQQNLRSSPEPQVVRQPSPSQNLNSALSNEDLQVDKAAVILPSDLNAYDSDDTDASLNLHFGNFGTAGAIPKEQFQRQTPSAVTRQPVGRPVTSAPAKENKELPVTSAPQSAAGSQAQPARKQPHPSEKKQAPQQPLRPAPAPAGMGVDSGLGDELNFPPPHMQMNPQAAFSSYNPGGHFFMPSGQFALSEMDPSANPMTHHNPVNYYDPSFQQGTSYRASSPHQGDVSSKYQTQYREKYPPQQPPQAASSPVQDRHDKHRQDSGSPPPRGTAQGHPQSPQSPPPGQHPTQPQPLPYSIPTSQYPQIYGYPYQYSYPATSSQFTGFSRYPVHYPKHFPNMSATSSGGYPLSPPTSSEMLGYPDEVQMMAADYSKSPYMPPVMQSFFHTGMSDPSSAPTHMGIGGKAQTTHTPPSSNTPHVSSSKTQQSFPNSVSSVVNQNPDMSASGPYKQDYTGGELRGASASNYYKGYAGQPGHQHNPSQFGGQQGGQYVQQGGYQAGNGQGQFPFMHQPPHHLMQGQQQPQQQNSGQGQASFP